MPKPKEYSESTMAEVGLYLIAEIDAGKVNDEQKSKDRQMADQLYLSKRLGKARRGKSQVVSSDVHDAIETVLPDLLEIFAGSDDPVTIKPRQSEAFKAAKTNRELIRYQTQRQLPWFRILYTWFKDALLYRNGYVTWGWDYRWREDVVEYEFITARDLEEKLADGAEVVEQGEAEFNPIFIQPVGYTDAVLLERIIERDQPKIRPVAPGSFIISADAESIEDAPFCAVRDFPTWYQVEADGRSLGYFDLDQVPRNEAIIDADMQAKANELGRDDTLGSDLSDSMRIRVERWECYFMWPDEETGHMEPMKATVINECLVHLTPNQMRQTPVISISPILITHRHEGRSLVDLVEEVQRIKTALYRSLIDFIALNNSPQTIVERDSGADLNALMQHRPSSIVQVDSGKAGAIQPLKRQPLGNDVWRFVEWIEQAKEARVGVTRLNQGLDQPGAANDTARGMLSLMQRADKRLRLIARLFAEEGLKPLFRSLIWLNQNFVDRELIINISDTEDLTITPDMLGGDFDLVVNVGLGNSDNVTTVKQMKEMLGVVAKILPGMPGGKTMLTPANVYQIFKAIWEAMGYKASQFITDPETAEAHIGGDPRTEQQTGRMPGAVRPGPAGGQIPGIPGIPGVRPGLPGPGAGRAGGIPAQPGFTGQGQVFAPGPGH